MSQDGWSLEQEEAPCTPSAAPPPSLCSNNCGFFGSPATMNLCSSCYKNLVLLKPPPPPPPVPACASPEPEDPKKIDDPALSQAPSPFEPASSLSSSSASSSALAGCSVAVASIVDGSVAASVVVDGSVCREKVQPLRCFACQKKVGLRGFKCRCGDVFCAYHRYSDQHSCSFDYKAAGRVSIEVANPVVKAEKLHRI